MLLNCKNVLNYIEKHFKQVCKYLFALQITVITTNVFYLESTKIFYHMKKILHHVNGLFLNCYKKKLLFLLLWFG